MSDEIERSKEEVGSLSRMLTVDEIKAMPTGFKVVHFPREVEAFETGNPDSPYRWEHKETVIPLFDNLSIREFGYIVVIDGEPLLYSYAWDGKPYDNVDFRQMFGVGGEPLKNGESYTRTDFTENGTLEKSQMTSYFVGADAAGRLYSGYAEVVKLPKLENLANKTQHHKSDRAGGSEVD